MARSQRRLLVTLAWVLAVLVSIAMFFGFAYFFVPLAIVALVVLISYSVIAHARSRNPMRLPPHGPHEHYADGQPLGRADLHEHELEIDEQEERRLAEEEAERRRAEHEGEPPGELGPPPHVPFP